MRVWRTRIIGCGGIGGFFAPLASKILTWHANAEQLIHLHDGDEYEPRNRERQMVFSRDPSGGVKENKAENMKRLLHSLAHPLCELKVHDKYIEDEDHVAGLCVEDSVSRLNYKFEVWCLCVDNDATRKFVYEGIEQTHCNVMVIDMANEEHTGDVILHGFFDNGQEHKWHPEHPFKAFPQLREPKDKHPAAYCQTQAPIHPQIICTNAMAATIGSRMLWQMLENDVRSLPTYVTFNMGAYRVRKEV